MKVGFHLSLITIFVLCQTNSWAATGRTVGQFGVSSTGTAQYNIPIWTPPGLKGLQPSLTLTYDSHSNYGILGPGWSLGGLSSIARCNRSYAQDGSPGAISLTYADAFCLDGNRLRLTSSETLSTYGQGGTTYQTEIANFSNVVASTALAGNGPSYFTVQGKDGLTYEYGNTTDSKIIPVGSTTPHVWALDKVTDRAGNHAVFTYTVISGAFVIASIQYTAPNGSSTYPYKVAFAYTPKSANDTLSKYLAGTQVQQTEQLGTITITSSGTIVRKYNLLYTTSAATMRATLTSVQECGGSAGTDCLATTSVSYQSGTAGVASPTNASGSGANKGLVYSVDIDGDGKRDLVFGVASGTNTQWWVQLATATGYAAPINSGAVGKLLLDNFDATGQVEILAPVGSTWYLYKYNGTSFTATSTGASSAGGVYASADVNGDGRPDLVYINGTSISVQLNSGSGTSVSFAAPVTTALNIPVNSNIDGLFGNNMLPNSPLKHYDFDGDGRDDVILHHDFSPRGGTTIDTYTALLSRGTAFQNGTDIIDNTNPNTPIEVVNWNDDNCADMVRDTTIAISDCNGAYGTTLTLPASASIALDWDGDGRTDVLANVGGIWELYRSEGNAFAAGISTGIAASSGTWIVTDKDGDGLDDLLFANSAASYAIYYGVHNGAGHPADLMSSINDNYGNTVAVNYTSIAESNYQRTMDATFPYRDYIGPLYVVYHASFSDPSNLPSGTYTKQYYYYGAWINLQGRGFTGFNSYSVVDSRVTLFEHPYFERAFPYTGMMYEDVWANGATYPRISQATPAIKTLDNAANNQRYFPYFSGITTNEVEVGGSEDGVPISTTLTSYTYDNYGNATTVATTVTDTDPASPYVNDTWTTTTVNTISPSTSTWCLSLPTETQVTKSSTAPSGTSITRTIAYNNPDYTNCRQTEKVIEPNSATYKVVEDYVYDTAFGDFGNLHSITVTGVGMTPRVTTVGWTTNGQFPITITNPLSQTITLAFDPNSGMKTSQTDPNYTTGNPLKTTWTYDNFGRELSELRADGTSTTFAYTGCAANGCVNANNKMTVTKTIVNVGGSTQSVQNTYLDSIDRLLVTSSTMLSGAYNRNERQYNSLGLVVQQGAPCTFVSCTTYWTSNYYDVLNRLTKVQRPISATNSTLQTTLIQYAGRTTTVTDPQGKNTSKINLVTGGLARSQDHNAYSVNFRYDAFGSVLSVTDSLSKTLDTMTYDYGLNAFQRTYNDADLGSRTSTYDALGELTTYADSKGQSVSVLYDALSRPTSRTEPDLTTTWTWGNTAGSYNIGKIQTVTAASSVGAYSEGYVYDSKTRLSAETISIPGDAAYTYTLAYNGTTGLLDTLQYPLSTSGYQLKLQYAYQNGFLQQISDVSTGTHYWIANATNPRGQYTQETLGNNVVVNHALDAVTGHVSSIQAGVNGGAALQNNSYLFDEMGNLAQRQDNNQGLTENIYYDNLYRVSSTTLNGTTNQATTYDSAGDVLTWTINGGTPITLDYVTPQSGCTYYANAQPHAVRLMTQSSSNAPLCYDANGNTLSFGGIETVSWTSFNQPNSIVLGAVNSSSQFFYNAEHQRYKQSASYFGSPETTFYVGGLMEKVITPSGTAYRHYIPAGSNTALYVRWSTGSNPTYYVTRDHFGSSSVVTDVTGAAVVKESFAAWGFRRGSDWGFDNPSSGDLTNIANTTRRGFTGQEMLDNLDLVNLNGRVYGASQFPRMMSPDPTIPNPGNTQSFNRYSYVNNNPLSYTDPTGFSADCLPDQGTCSGSDMLPEIVVPSNTPRPPEPLPDVPVIVVNLVYNGANPAQDGMVQVRNPGADTLSTINSDGTTTPWDPEKGIQSLDPILVTSTGYSWVSTAGCGSSLDCGFNYGGFSKSPLFLGYQPYIDGVGWFTIGTVAGFGAGGVAGAAGRTAARIAVSPSVQNALNARVLGHALSTANALSPEASQVLVAPTELAAQLSEQTLIETQSELMSQFTEIANKLGELSDAIEAAELKP